MKYPKYVFLTYGTYESQWWVKQSGDMDYECSSEDVAEVLQFSLAVSYFHNSSREEDIYYSVCYDAVWALAYVLHEVAEDIDLHRSRSIDEMLTWGAHNSTGYWCGQTVARFCSSSNNMHSLIRKYLKTTNFSGMSVSVSE